MEVSAFQISVVQNLVIGYSIGKQSQNVNIDDPKDAASFIDMIEWISMDNFDVKVCVSPTANISGKAFVEYVNSLEPNGDINYGEQ